MNRTGKTEPRPVVDCGRDRGNDLPVLHELKHALDRLLSFGEDTIIDVRSLPFGPFDEERLQALLGEGEVHASVNALGESRVTETAYSGIWWVEHRDPQDAVLARFLEVTFLPGILKAQQADVADGRQRLEAALGALSEQGNNPADRANP